MAVAFRPTLAPPTWRIVAAASIGNALEWFDLLVYGYLAVTISRLFFPSNDENASLLLALGTFGVSYLIRPLGALALGAYADRSGRKASLLASIQLMMIGTLLMAALPTYRSIGLLAPAGVLIARLLQGFSIGGEFGSGTSFLVEHGPDRKGFFGSLMGRTGVGGRARVRVWDRASHSGDAIPTRLLGMATSLFVRSSDRADRLLHPPSHRRDARIRRRPALADAIARTADPAA
jgi:hypothetical protein